MCTKPKWPGREFFIAGSTGFIGNTLSACLPGARAVGRQTLDLARLNPTGQDETDIDLDGWFRRGVRYGVITAGITAIRRCEEEPEATRAVNVTGTLELARRLADCGMKTLWFSSDYVFDGRTGGYADDAPLSPLNEYGRQKAEVEQRLPEVTGGNCLILRLGKTYDLQPGNGTLLDEMARLLLAGKPVRAATDQTMNPTWVGDVAAAVHELAQAHVGVVNCCSGRVVTRYAVAVAVAVAVGADPNLVRPISLDDLAEPFIRPKDTGLVASAAVERLDFLPPERAIDILARRITA
jgi:dTDP-4-dehydrorhamnose reductase